MPAPHLKLLLSNPPLYVKGHWHTFDFSYVVGAMWHQFELRRGVVPGIETHLVSCWVAIDAGVIRRLILGHAYDLGLGPEKRDAFGGSFGWWGDALF